MFLPSWLYVTLLYISNAIGPNDLLHPSPAQNFKTFHVFLIYFPKYLFFSTLQSYASYVAFHWFPPALIKVILTVRH